MDKKLLPMAMLFTTIPVLAETLPLDTGTGSFSAEFISTGPTTVVEEGWSFRREVGEDSETSTIDNRPEDMFDSIYAEAYETESGANYRWGLTATVSGTHHPSEPGEFVQADYHWSENNLLFSGNDYENQEKGETFVAGVLSFTNGGSYTTTNPDSVQFNLASSSDDNEFNQVIALEIAIEGTPNFRGHHNPLPANVAADYIYFPEFIEFGSFRVFEGETGSVELLAEFNSLNIIGFGRVLTPDTAFTSTSLAAVPVPAAVWLFGSGIIGLAGLRKKHQYPPLG